MASRIAVISHSLYGHTRTLAKEAARGVSSTSASIKHFTFGETLPDKVLDLMKANKDLKDEFPAVTPQDLPEYDGYIMAFGTRFGRAPAQVSNFFDQTGALWAQGALTGKFATTLTSTGTLQGGQETTHLTTYPYLAHHGICMVPNGYISAPLLSNMEEIHGGSPWGASTLAGSSGDRKVSKIELEIAYNHGAHFAKIVNAFVKGSK